MDNVGRVRDGSLEKAIKRVARHRMMTDLPISLKKCCLLPDSINTGTRILYLATHNLFFLCEESGADTMHGGISPTL